MEKFRFKKKYGQNFINNNEIIEKIIKNINVTPNNLIIEIGPGAGILTKHLKNLQKQLICYEIDQETKVFLDKIKDDKTTIIYEDFIKADIISDIKKTNYDKVSFIANIPYYITTPIIKKIINLNIDINEIILMVQKEVAERFTAKVGTKQYNSLTIFLSYYFDIEKLFDVNKKYFYPIPKVDSAIVKFTPKKRKLELENEELFFKLINEAFTQKRKILKNNIKSFDYNKILPILKKHNFSDNVRAEEIPIDIFVEIANSLCK